MDDLESSRSFAQYCCELSRESRWLKVALRTHEVACAICCGFTILPPSLALRAMSGESDRSCNACSEVEVRCRTCEARLRCDIIQEPSRGFNFSALLRRCRQR